MLIAGRQEVDCKDLQGEVYSSEFRSEELRSLGVDIFEIKNSACSAISAVNFFNANFRGGFIVWQSLILAV